MFDMQAMTKFSNQDIDTAMQNNNKLISMQPSKGLLPTFFNSNCHTLKVTKQKEKIKCTYKHKED